jgi:chromosome segregation ATPase
MSMRYKISITIAVVLGVITISCMAPPPSTLPTETTATVIFWLRQVPGLVGMLLAAFGTYMYFRVAKYNKSLEASENTVKIYKEQLDAMNSRAKQYTDDHAVLQAEYMRVQGENKELRGRTDLTEVIKTQQELLSMKKEHDAEMIAMIRNAVEGGQKQYGEVMTALEKTLNYLSTSAREGAKLRDENHELLVTMSSSLGRIVDKIAGVEIKVNEHDEKLDTVKDTVEDIASKVDPPEPGPDPRRRRNDTRR